MAEVLHTTHFLRELGGLAELGERYAIKVARHRDYRNLVHLKYSQINSPMHEPIVQECRGLILDEAADWRVVAYPFNKFFNHGEPNAAPIDWSTATVYEKLDGSLMTLYWYAGKWQVSSSGMPDAAGRAHSAGLTFASLFWKTWNDLGYRLPEEPGSTDSTGGPACYMFELMTPSTRIIVSHGSARLVLIGARDLTTFAELAPEPIANRMGWDCVRSFPLASIADVIAAAQVLNPLACEGYVVRDASFRRQKVKCPQYVALAHLKEGLTARRILEIVRGNEAQEVLASFPEWTAAFGEVEGAFKQLCDDVERAYEQLRSIESQKDFAARAVTTRVPAAVFALRAGKANTAREFFAACTLPALERAIGLEALEAKVAAALSTQPPSE